MNGRAVKTAKTEIIHAISVSASATKLVNSGNIFIIAVKSTEKGALGQSGSVLRNLPLVTGPEEVISGESIQKMC